MLRIKAKDLGPQNIGSVVTIYGPSGVTHATIARIEQPLESRFDDVNVYVYVESSKKPLTLGANDLVELSLQHSSMSISRLQKDIQAFVEWFQPFMEELHPYEEVAA